MKVYITITEEPLFINPFLERVIRAIPSEIVGIAVLKGSLLSSQKKKSRAKYLLAMALITDPIQLLKRAALIFSFSLMQILRRIGIRNPLSITKIAQQYKIPLVYTNNINSIEFVNFLKQQEPDVIINQAQAILKKDFISVPKIGCLNRHGALLPKFRGRFAPFWAYVNMEKETGVSIHFVDEKLDNGPLLVQKKIRIGRFDTVDTLLNKVFSIAPQAMLEALELIRRNQYKDRLIDNNNEHASYFSSPTISDAFRYRLVMIKRFFNGQ